MGVAIVPVAEEGSLVISEKKKDSSVSVDDVIVDPLPPLPTRQGKDCMQVEVDDISAYLQRCGIPGSFAPTYAKALVESVGCTSVDYLKDVTLKLWERHVPPPLHRKKIPEAAKGGCCAGGGSCQIL